MDLQRESDVERLRQAALLLEAENQRLAARVLKLTRELSTARGEDALALQLRLAELEQQLAKRNHLLFGTSSEQRHGGTKREKPDRVRRPGHGHKPQPQLEFVEKKHELDAPDQVCGSCGGQLEEWKGQTEDSEEVEVIERKFVLIKHRRQKYRCRCGGCVETAPAPLKLFEGARYSIGWAIEVAAQKYLDHLPLERQVRIMEREGLEVDSQTLWDYLERLVRLLEPAWKRLHQYVLSKPVVGIDETRWLLMGAPEGTPSRWQMWALSATDAMVYRILESRSAEAARTVVGDYRGTLMADGYGVYESLKKNGGNFTLVNCWSHVRRPFIDSRENFPQADEVLDLIGELYNIEARCPTGPPGDELRRELRDKQSRPIVARIQQWALQQRALPESSLGKAIAYMGGRWNALVRFLDDPRIPIDNNATERGLRGPVVGRKNHYGSRSRRGTEVAAVLYSLMESAKLCGLEPKAYLRQAVNAALAGEQIPLPHELTTATA
jgi:transposase